MTPEYQAEIDRAARELVQALDWDRDGRGGWTRNDWDAWRTVTVSALRRLLTLLEGVE